MSLTRSLASLLCPLSVVVLHPHGRDHHRPDAAGTPVLRGRGRQRRDHGRQRRAVVVVAVVKVAVGAVAARGRGRVGRRGAFDRVAAALVAVVLGHATDKMSRL